MPLSLVVTTAPTAEPLTVAEAKAHLRVDAADEDTLIGFYIQAAREFAEAYTGRTLISTTYTLKLDGFPRSNGVIELPAPPLQSITSISYADLSDGSATSLDSSDYRVDIHSEPGRIEVAYGDSWPTPRDVVNAVEVVFVAGYGAAGSDVPEGIRSALRLLIGHLHENREAVVIGAGAKSVPLAVQALLDAYRVSVLP